MDFVHMGNVAMKKKSAVTFCVVAVLVGLVFLFRQPPMQYRTDDRPCHLTAQETCDHASWSVESRPIAGLPATSAAADDLYLGFLEFDDQGQMFNRPQGNKVLDTVQALAAQRAITIVVFAHGWNHNASAEDTNVQGFHKMLRELFDAEGQFAQPSKRAPERAIVGIYLGWRGKSATGPMQYPTFWARKATAQRVGNDGAFEVLYRLNHIRNTGAAPVRNRLVLVGHSFGGALIFTATAHALSASLEDLSSGPDKPFADLVVIINAAIEAQRFENLLRRARELEGSLKDKKPLMIALTSSQDMATKWAFPAGRRVATLFESYRPGPSPDASALGGNEAAADRTALGHYRPYVTHVLAPCKTGEAFAALRDCPPSSAGVGESRNLSDKDYMSAMISAANDWKSTRKAQGWSIQFPTAVLLHAAGPVDGPVMNITTHPSLSSGHNDIWQSPLMLFVRDLIAINHFVDRPANQPTASAGNSADSASASASTH